MVAEDHQPALKSPDQYHHEYSYGQDQDQEEEEDTLSLCDLPIYSDSFKWDDDLSSSSKADHSSNSWENDRDHEFFEFFSDDFTASTNPSIQKTDIIFCGKLIPYKGAQYDIVSPKSVASPKARNQETHEPKIMVVKKKQIMNPRKKKSLFHYLKLGNNQKESSKGNKVALTSSRKSSSSCEGFPVGKVAKVSVAAASSSSAPIIKPRWYLYMFGMVRFPTEMELRDMRTRQSRRQRLRSHSSAMFTSSGGENIRETTKEKVSSRRSRRRRRSGIKGLWGLLRALRCQTRLTEKVAKATYGCGAMSRP